MGVDRGEQAVRDPLPGGVLGSKPFNVVFWWKKMMQRSTRVIRHDDVGQGERRRSLRARGGGRTTKDEEMNARNQINLFWTIFHLRHRSQRRAPYDW